MCEQKIEERNRWQGTHLNYLKSTLKPGKNHVLVRKNRTFGTKMIGKCKKVAEKFGHVKKK